MVVTKYLNLYLIKTTINLTVNHLVFFVKHTIYKY